LEASSFSANVVAATCCVTGGGVGGGSSTAGILDVVAISVAGVRSANGGASILEEGVPLVAAVISGVSPSSMGVGGATTPFIVLVLGGGGGGGASLVSVSGGSVTKGVGGASLTTGAVSEAPPSLSWLVVG
jgi:hypothetical protein